MIKRLIKGSKEAKLFMAKIRAKKGPAKKAAKKIGSVAESKKIKKELAAKKVRLVHGYETVKRKRKVSGIHKDTKSHNVKISVLSGLNNPNYAILSDLKAFEYKRNQSINKENFFINNSKKFKTNTIDNKLNKKYALEYKKLIKYYTLQINKLKKLIK